MTIEYFTAPTPPTKLQILQFLNPRVILTDLEKRSYNNLYKGYMGERKFCNLLKKELPPKTIILNDLLLKVNNTEFQIDSLLIYQEKVLLFEVKNYEGDFYIQKDNWYTVETKQEIRDPLLQLKRSEYLLRQLLQKLSYNYKIESYVVFINQEFTLYQAHMNLPIILPTQLRRFFRKINIPTFKQTEKDIKLLRQFLKLHNEKSSYEQLPHYDYEQLEKGIICNTCNSFLSLINYKKLICANCDNEEAVESAIMRSVKEFHTLFPDQDITTSTIYEWCKETVSKKIIRNILLKNLKMINKSRYTYYIFKSDD
ncbi:NERD domain-containing protein [Cerasibacillus terrae]|uniref:NERD domain-containing protein n=1 Tax=Cerasibacillus terrae TaxID=2498845 RepID=A0A5C8NV95_9BACI|nr:nuclease-related domain-containing protein [Cerasibacillus terrae]TXL65118.1 NERD domain-containing protein [Cerasibacillus terrae]